MAGIDWPGLFKWSTKYHDGTAPSNFTVMNDEDREFLTNALKEAFAHIEDPNKALQEAIGQIKSEDRTDETITTALEVIDRLCDDVDVARNVEKLDGLQPMMDLAQSSKSGSIMQRSLEILALLFSNNQPIQEAGVKRGALQVFLKLTQESVKGSEERAKAFRALVALVRQVEEFEELLLHEHGGVQLLATLLDPEEDARTREKAAGFALSITINGRLKEEEVGSLAAAMTSLFSDVAAGSIQYREQVSACALEFARAAPGCCPPAFKDAAQARLAELRKGAREEGDEGAEEAALEECLAKLLAAR